MNVRFCTHCGGAAGEGSWCPGCGRPLTASAATPPADHAVETPSVFLIGTNAEAEPTPETPAGPGQLVQDDGVPATPGARLGAYLLDGVIGAVAGVIAGSVPIYLGSVGTVLGLLLLVGYIGLVWSMMARQGNSPGQAIVGIQVVRLDGDPRLGYGLAIGRYLLRGLFLGITLHLGALTIFGAGNPQHRGWWDRQLGTRVIRSRPGSAHTAASQRAVGNPGLRNGPAWAVIPPSEPPPAEPVSMSPARWNDSPAAPATGWNASPATVSVDVPGSSSVSTAEHDVPWGAPQVPGGLVTVVPGRERREAGPVAAPIQDAVEHTRLRGAPASGGAGASWELALDDGAVHHLDGALLLGRDPTTDDGVPILAIADPSRSVSKTHLLLEISDGRVWVTDNHSTNGVAVLHEESATRCVPGERVPVPDHATVRFGDRHLTVRATRHHSS